MYLLSDGMETSLFVNEQTLQTYNKIRLKPHFIWEFKVKISYDLFLLYPGNAKKKSVIIQLHQNFTNKWL